MLGNACKVATKILVEVCTYDRPFLIFLNIQHNTDGLKDESSRKMLDPTEDKYTVDLLKI